jgi:prepilin-type N-terminal cleavage/methylation domain-containing protein
MRRRGFTLLELALVLALMAILLALAAPSFQGLILRGRTAEARTLLDAIAQAELSYFRDHGRYLACRSAPEGALPPGGVKAFDNEAQCWRDLGVRVEGPVRYRYEVSTDGKAFTAVAQGDLDGDGQPSTFTLEGASLRVTVKDELE